MPKCRKCERELDNRYSETSNKSCCPYCLTFLNAEKRRNVTLWKVLGFLSGLGLFIVIAIVYLCAADGGNHRAEAEAFTMLLIPLFFIYIYSRAKRTESKKVFLNTKIRHTLEQGGIDIYYDWELSNEITRVIDDTLSK